MSLSATFLKKSSVFLIVCATRSCVCCRATQVHAVAEKQIWVKFLTLDWMTILSLIWSTVLRGWTCYCYHVVFIATVQLQIWCDFDRALSLTFILLTWRIWWAPNDASKWQMGYNSVIKGLIYGNKKPTRWNRGFYCRSYCLLNMFRGNTMPIIRSSRVLYSGCCLWYFVLWFSSYLKTTARNTTDSNHCVILLSSWWWA